MTFALLLLIAAVVIVSSGRQRQHWRRRDEELSEGMYAELDELRARVQELEDRQEFSERILADVNDPASREA